MSLPVEKYCAFCGRAFDDPNAGWPKECPCGQITYRNPLPVVNVLVPVIDMGQGGRIGVLVIKRGIQPCLGQWALPGGFMELGETWAEGASRELREETGLVVPPRSISLSDVDSNPKRDHLLVFGVTVPYELGKMPPIARNEEVTDSKIIFEPEELAFPPHTRAVRAFFDAD